MNGERLDNILRIVERSAGNVPIHGLVWSFIVELNVNGDSWYIYDEYVERLGSKIWPQSTSGLGNDETPTRSVTSTRK